MAAASQIVGTEGRNPVRDHPPSAEPLVCGRGSVVAYDWGFEAEGQQHIQRSFVLLDEGVQTNQPVIFPSRQQGWWYCDLVALTDHASRMSVDDFFIDVIVGPPDHPYRMLELNEYADARTTGRPHAGR